MSFTLDASATAPSDHVVLVNEQDRFLSECIVGYVRPGLAENRDVLVIATAPHRHAVDALLDRSPRQAGTDARLTTRDARRTLDDLPINGGVDAGRVRRSPLHGRATRRDARLTGADLAVDGRHQTLDEDAQSRCPKSAPARRDCDDPRTVAGGGELRGTPGADHCTTTSGEISLTRSSWSTASRNARRVVRSAGPRAAVGLPGLRLRPGVVCVWSPTSGRSKSPASADGRQRATSRRSLRDSLQCCHG